MQSIKSYPRYSKDLRFQGFIGKHPDSFNVLFNVLKQDHCICFCNNTDTYNSLPFNI